MLYKKSQLTTSSVNNNKNQCGKELQPARALCSLIFRDGKGKGKLEIQKF